MRFVYSIEKRLPDGCWMWKEDLEPEYMNLAYPQDGLRDKRREWCADNVRITIQIKED